jgi:VanZ family protein
LSNTGTKGFWWALSVGHIALIWYFSSRAGSEVGLPAPWDKVAHFCTYALLGFFLTRASGSRRIGFGLAALYGVVDEIHQSFVPLRDASLWDWVADALGSSLGAWLGKKSGGSKKEESGDPSLRLP